MVGDFGQEGRYRQCALVKIFKSSADGWFLDACQRSWLPVMAKHVRKQYEGMPSKKRDTCLFWRERANKSGALRRERPSEKKKKKKEWIERRGIRVKVSGALKSSDTGQTISHGFCYLWLFCCCCPEGTGQGKSWPGVNTPAWDPLSSPDWLVLAEIPSSAHLVRLLLLALFFSCSTLLSLHFWIDQVDSDVSTTYVSFFPHAWSLICLS